METMVEAATKERPILFSGAMVRAIRDRLKAQTRRVVKGAALAMLEDGFTPEYVADPGNSAWCPYGAPGDRLWVRETWQALNGGSYDEQKNPMEGYCDLRYAATDPLADCDADTRGYRWRPSIHMPRWASRITLDILKVRVERLNDISEADAIAEGYESRAAFLNGDWAKQHAENNPYVWVIEFRRTP